MVTRSLPSLCGLALNVETGSAPDWVHLVPAGPEIAGRDRRAWRMTNPAAVVAAFDPAKEPQVDIEHSSQLLAPSGHPAPAVGWIKQLEARVDGIWGRVDWTVEGATAVNSRAYRYLSPVFAFDPATREVLRIVSVGLTNSPNLELAAMNAAEPEHKETAPVDPAILEALGLKPTADTAAAVLAINALKLEHQTALNAAQQPDPAQFVPAADHQLALNRIAAFEADEKIRADVAIEGAVSAAIAAGKIAPSSKDFHVAACRSEGGLERFNAFVGAAPVIAAPSGLDTKKPTTEAVALNAEERAVCHAMGMAEEDFIAAKAAQKKG